MSLQRCSKIQRKEVKVGDDDIGASGVVSYLLENIANDDILFEIFVRIPDCRSAIVCSSVSRHCHSLISHPWFVPRFISHHQQHQDRYPPPFTIIFRKADKFCRDWSVLNFQPICMLFSEESAFLHGNSTPPKCYLDFLPSPMVIRASCDDLLLLTPEGRYSIVFYVCNPVTKQFYRLPDCRWLCAAMPQPIGMCGYALARMPEESECHFKLVLFHMPRHPHPPTMSQSLTIYCSKLRKWKRIHFFYPTPRIYARNKSVDVVMCNGNLYWLELEISEERVLSFDLWGTRGCSVIDFPDDFWWFRSPDFRGRVRERIGTVGGELRLIQVVLTKKKFFDLKVWRLLDSSSSSSSSSSSPSSWVLVHDKKHSKRPNKEDFVATFVHPTNGDMVFMVWGKSVFQYNLMMEEADAYEMIAELQEPLKLNTGLLVTTDRLVSLTMLHPTWPTPLPLTRVSV